jgi:hypothetical protein
MPDFTCMILSIHNVVLRTYENLGNAIGYAGDGDWFACGGGDGGL